MTILTTTCIISLIIAAVVGPSALTVYHCRKNRKARKIDFEYGNKLVLRRGGDENVREFVVAAPTTPTSSNDQQESETSTLNVYTALDTDSIETVSPFPAVEWHAEGKYFAWWEAEDALPPKEEPPKSPWWMQNPNYFWNSGLGL
ncbi:10270_t:CDS:2 [Ambispora leptoticha]|uniref:10270_t:CDS:1 n=1 Tax=Ambispora leptoticha TaxID=144679 RepID=A0A9N9AGX5_9GLOM|nr:10270_t:CDS:2 [Ambispora leptoticha]